MADLQVARGYLTQESADVQIMHKEIQIQERKSRIIRLKQDIEDILKGKILDLQANIKMLERDLEVLEAELGRLRGLSDVIDGEIVK